MRSSPVNAVFWYWYHGAYITFRINGRLATMRVYADGVTGPVDERVVDIGNMRIDSDTLEARLHNDMEELSIVAALCNR